MFFQLEDDRRAEQEELARFIRLYNHQSPKSRPLPTSVWDDRADAWESEFRGGSGSTAKSLERVEATVAYLQNKGVLGPNSDVVDVGCGPGRFVAGFAGVCRSALGIDISPRMMEYAEKYAGELGRANARFMACDFHALDVEKAGLAQAFDLVFCSISPAANGMAGLEKLMRLSRGWCFCSNFVAADNHLESRMAQEVFGLKAAPRWDAHWVYALFNLLFVAGYFPQVDYYSRHKETAEAADRENAGRYMQCLPPAYRTEENTQKALHWLESQADTDGNVLETSDFTYAWILWDVRRKSDRTIFPVIHN